MYTREEVLAILKKTFALEDAYKILEYFESRIPEDVSTQRDIYEIKLEIEKLRADLTKEIETLRGETNRNIEKLRGEVVERTEKIRADTLKWSFAFWISPMILLAGILFKLFS